MPQNRYYFSGALVKGHDIFLKDDEFHYLRNVMRSKVGQEVEIINGKGSLALAAVSKLQEKEAILSITSVTTEEQKPLTCNLALAFLKPAHFEYAIEKACEVGVSNFFLFPGDRSEKKAVSDQYLKRLHTIILSSTKQCGRLFLPEIQVKKALKECLAGLVLFGDLESTTPLQKFPLEPIVTLVIGPESGLSDQEGKILFDAGAKGVRLHSNTLRAETAAVVGITLITTL